VRAIFINMPVARGGCTDHLAVHITPPTIRTWKTDSSLRQFPSFRITQLLSGDGKAH
jgi:hypothetical protein